MVPQASPEAAGVIFARGLCEVRSHEEAILVQRAALHAARTLAQHPSKRFLVTLQDTGGDFGLSGRAEERAWTGGLAGLAKTAAAEWPDAAIKAIDVVRAGVSADRVAERVVAELILGGTDVEVGLDRAGRRSIVRHRPAPYAVTSAGTPCVRPGSVIVVSGGARGVTAAALSSLCKNRPRMALLGRTVLFDEPAETHEALTDADLRRALLARAKTTGVALSPKELARDAKRILDCREIKEHIAALQQAGAEVSYHAVDVRSAEAVRNVIGEVRKQWGPIQGLIHGAGVLADGALAAQTDAQFDLVFGTKVDGLRWLLAATADDPLELLIVFSSVAGRFGNSGQAAYAMANEVLSCVAASERARRGPRCLVRSLAWGPWAGGMVTPGLARLFEKAGVQLIALDAGARALECEIESRDDWPQVVLMNGDPPDTARPLHGGRTFAGERSFEILVNAATCPYLDGHRIAESPVVPAVLVLEWFLRAAGACCPSRVVRACRDLKVLSGVRVEAFDGRGIRLVVHARVIDDGSGAAKVEVKLFDDRDKLRYAGIVDTGEATAAPDVRQWTGDPSSADLPQRPSDGQPWPWSRDEAYSSALFHTGQFAAIQSLELVSETGASGEVVGLRALGWPDGAWCTDVAVMDGGVQICALWGHRILGRLPLPTSMGAFHLFARGPVQSNVRCFVRGRRAGQYRVVADLVYVAEGGRVLGHMQDLELHLSAATPHKATEPGGA